MLCFLLIKNPELFYNLNLTIGENRVKVIFLVKSQMHFEVLFKLDKFVHYSVFFKRKLFLIKLYKEHSKMKCSSFSTLF